MLHGDLQMSNEVAAKKRGKKPCTDEDDSTTSFHFIAYVPIGGTIWKLDGLERQPQKLCDIKTEDWVNEATPDIQARMTQYGEEQIEFSILSLVKEPLLGFIDALAENVKSLAALSKQLDILRPDWKQFIASSGDEGGISSTDVVVKPDAIYGLTSDICDRASTPQSTKAIIADGAASELMELSQKLVTEQVSLRASIREEQQSAHSDLDRAASRCFDYGPSVHNLMGLLGRKRLLQSFLS